MASRAWDRAKSALSKTKVYIPWLYLTRYPFLYVLSFLMLLAEYTEAKSSNQYDVPSVVVYIHIGVVVLSTTFLIFQYKPRLFSLVLAVEQPLANYYLYSVATNPPEWQKIHYSSRLMLQFGSFLLLSSGYANYPARRSIHPKVRHVAVCSHGIYLVSLTYLILNEATLRAAMLEIFGRENGETCTTILGLVLGACAAFYLSGHPSKLLSIVTLILVTPCYVALWNINYWRTHYKAYQWYCIRVILDDSCFLACLCFYMFMFR